MAYSDDGKEHPILDFVDRILPLDDTGRFVVTLLFFFGAIVSMAITIPVAIDGISTYRVRHRIEARWQAERMQPEWDTRAATVADAENKAHKFARSDTPPARWIRETYKFDAPVATNLPIVFRCRPNDNLLRVYETARGEPMHQYKACCRVRIGKQPDCSLSRSW